MKTSAIRVAHHHLTADALSTRPDYGESAAALPGEDEVSKTAFNKQNPVELLSQLIKILENEDLDDAVKAVRGITKQVNKAWQSR